MIYLSTLWGLLLCGSLSLWQYSHWQLQLHMGLSSHWSLMSLLAYLSSLALLCLGAWLLWCYATRPIAYPQPLTRRRLLRLT